MEHTRLNCFKYKEPSTAFKCTINIFNVYEWMKFISMNRAN